MIASTRTRAEASALADKIADEHGCELAPTAGPRPALVVQAVLRQGDPQDRQRLQRCFKALQLAGISTHGWVS